MTLTTREFEIITLLGDGLQDREIGEALYLSPKTVKFHLVSARRKLGARNRTHAVSLAYRAGILGDGA